MENPFYNGLWLKSFAAIDYLMFKSSSANSIWVPLGMFSWQFYINVNYSTIPGVPTYPLTLSSAVGPGTPEFNSNVGALPAWFGKWDPPSAALCIV